MRYFRSTYWCMIFFLGVFFFSIQNVSAHGDGGEFKKEKDGYVADVGFDPQTFSKGNATAFNFLVSRGKEKVDFTDVWVRITKGESTTYASGVYNQEFGGASLLYTFEEEGDYVIHIRYEAQGKTLLETEMPVTILKADALKPKTPSGILTEGNVFSTMSPAVWVSLLIGIFTGIILQKLSMRRL